MSHRRHARRRRLGPLGRFLLGLAALLALACLVQAGMAVPEILAALRRMTPPRP